MPDLSQRALVGDVVGETCKGFIGTIRAFLAASEAKAATIYHCDLASPIITRGHVWRGHRFDQKSNVKAHRTRMLFDEQSSSVIGLSARTGRSPNRPRRKTAENC